MATKSEILNSISLINTYKNDVRTAIIDKMKEAQASTWFNERATFTNFAQAIKEIPLTTSSAEFPSDSKFAYSTWNNIPEAVITWVESSSQQCSNMFSYCTSLTTVGTQEAPLALQNLNNVSAMFRGCSSLTDIYLKGTSWTDTSSMFAGCTSLKNFNLDSSIDNVVNAESMFENCIELKSQAKVILSKYTTNCRAMYKNSGLSGVLNTRDNIGFNTDDNSITNASETFMNCPLSDVQTLYLQHCLECDSMFKITDETKAQLLATEDIYTERCVDMEEMFSGQIKLKTISSIDISSCTKTTNMFHNCVGLNRLVLIGLGNVEGQNFDLSDTKWGIGSEEALQSVIDTIDATNGYSPATLKVSSDTYNILQSNDLTSQFLEKNVTITT